MARSLTRTEKRILHLDDDEVVAGFYKEVLSEHDFHVEHFARISDCLAALEKSKDWDAVILDVMMPHGDVPDIDYAQTDDGLLTGMFVARMIKERWPELSIIILTNRSPKLVANHLEGLVPTRDIKSKFEWPPQEFAKYLNNRIVVQRDE